LEEAVDLPCDITDDDDDDDDDDNQKEKRQNMHTDRCGYTS
jgi:hypothetical protein